MSFGVERIIASGGATHSPLFMQIYADVAGKPLFVTREAEASLLGSAIVAAVGCGAQPSLTVAAQRMVGISHEYQPDAGRHAGICRLCPPVSRNVHAHAWPDANDAQNGGWLTSHSQ